MSKMSNSLFKFDIEIYTPPVAIARLGGGGTHPIAPSTKFISAFRPMIMSTFINIIF